MSNSAILFWTIIGAGVVTSKPAVASQIIDPGEELSTSAIPTPIQRLDDWKDWETWEAPAEIVKLAPFYKAGFDFDGLPIYVMEYGKWNYRRISNLSQDDVDIFRKYYEKITRHVIKDGEANRHRGLVLISDFDGFSLEHFASKESLKLALENFIGIVSLFQVLEYGFNINVNYAGETFINLSRPFMGTIFDKMEIYGTRSDKWKSALLRKIPQEQLPPKYGGNNKDWKPVALA